MAETQRRRDRFSPSVLLGDALLLLCALWGLAGSFLSLYGDPDAPLRASTVLDRCARQEGLFLVLAAVFALAALAVWSLPRFREAAAGGAAALLALAVWRGWDSVCSGAVLTCKTVADLFSARVDWGRTFDYESGRTALQDAGDTRLFLLLALALLALALGWAVVRARRWWLAVLLTLPPLLPGLLADFYPSWPAFMALSACWCVMLIGGTCKWAAPSGRGRLTLAAFPAVALMLAGLTLLLPMEGYTRPPWALRAEEDLANLASHASDYFSRWDGPFRTTITFVGSAEEADLANAGPLSYSGRTVLRISSDYDGRLYLRGASLAVYEDGVWKPLPEGAYEAYSSPGAPGVCPLYFPAMRREDAPAHTVTVDNVGAVGACVYAPYYPTVQDADESGMLPVEDAYLARRQGRWTHTVSFVEAEPQGQPSGSIMAGAADTPFDLDGSRRSYADFAYSHYLDVPEELRPELERVVDGFYDYSYSDGLIRSAQEDCQFAYERQYLATAAGWFLEERCRYDVDAPAAPEGVDPVAYFLNDSRRGYCMHYASAAVLMLRTMGIPARYVSGFTAESVPDRQVDVPDRAAHAWVEIWVDNFGWCPVEVTPAAAFDYMGQTGEYAPAVPSGGPTLPPEESEEPEPTDDPAPGESAPVPGSGGPAGEGGGPAALPGWLKWAAGGAGVCFLLWLGQYLAKRLRAGRMAGPDPDRAALACYGYLERLERWGGRIDPRALELAQKAKFSQHTVSPEELDELRLLADWERKRLCIALGPVERLLFRYFC